MSVAQDPSWPLHVEQVIRASSHQTMPFGCVVEAHRSVTSTNDRAAQLAAGGCPEGTLVVAAEQTRGRGRRGSPFHSPCGTGLYASTVLRPSTWSSTVIDPSGAPRAITLMAGVAVVEAVHALGAAGAELKWPNDVLARPFGTNRWRKLAGVLAEASIDTGGLQHVVLGVGLNVSAVPSDAGMGDVATCLADVTKPAPTLEQTLVALLRSLARAHRVLSREGPRAIIEAWRRHAPSMLGAAVSWMDGDVRRSGRAQSVDDTGALCVDTLEGTTRLVSGHLTWTYAGD